jgi:polygalacturonase
MITLFSPLAALICASLASATIVAAAPAPPAPAGREVTVLRAATTSATGIDPTWRIERRAASSAGGRLRFGALPSPSPAPSPDSGDGAIVTIARIPSDGKNDNVLRLVKRLGSADWSDFESITVHLGWRLAKPAQGRHRLFLVARSPGVIGSIPLDNALEKNLANDGALHAFTLPLRGASVPSEATRIDWTKITQIDITIDGLTADDAGEVYIASITGRLSAVPSDGVPLSPLRISNIPPAFYERPGLEKLPRTDYAALPVVNVRDAGATGDGETDDQPAFEKALKTLKRISAGNGGGILYVPAGIYVFYNKKNQATWTLEGDHGEPLRNIHIVGEGEASQIRCIPRLYGGRSWGATYAWDFGSAENITLRDLSFSIFPYYNARGIGFFRGMYPLQFGSYSPDARRVSGVQILRVTFDQGVIGPLFRRGCSASWIVDCRVNNTTADGVHIDTSSGITVAYNTIEYSGDDALASISVQSIKRPATANRFLHNTLIAAQCRGVAVGGTDIEVAGNWIERSQLPAIFLHAHGHNPVDGDPVLRPVVRDNILAHNNLSLSRAAYPGGILGEFNLRDALIENNALYATNGDGVNFHRYPTGKYKTGIEVFDPQGVVIRGNHIEASTGYGFQVEAGPRVTGLKLEGNTFVANGDGSVALRGKVPEAVFRDNKTDTPLSADAIGAAAEIAPDAVARGFAVTPGIARFHDIYRLVRDARDTRDATAAPLAQSPSPPPPPSARSNIRDSGARGDGVADDTAAIQRALDTAPATGGTLRIPAGRYRIATTTSDRATLFSALDRHLLVSGKTNLRIEGEPGAVLVFENPDAIGLRLVASEHVTISNLELRLTPPAGAPAIVTRRNRALLDAAGCRQLAIDRVTAIDSRGPGIRIDTCRDVTITNSTAQAAGTFGIIIESSDAVRVASCHLENSRDAGLRIDRTGGLTRTSRGVVFEDNTIIGVREGFGIAICAGDDARVTKNTIRDAWQSAIAFYQHRNLVRIGRVVLSGNVIENCAAGGHSPTRGAIALFGSIPSELEITNTRWQRTSGQPAIVMRALPAKNPVGAITLRGNNFGRADIELAAGEEKNIRNLTIE